MYPSAAETEYAAGEAGAGGGGVDDSDAEMGEAEEAGIHASFLIRITSNETRSSYY